MNNHINPNQAISWCYVFKTVCVAAGAGSIYLGYDLFIRGVTGAASISINAKSVGGQLLNASPGLFFAIIGAVVIVAAILRPVDVRSSSQTPKRVYDVQFANADREDDQTDSKT